MNNVHPDILTTYSTKHNKSVRCFIHLNGSRFKGGISGQNLLWEHILKRVSSLMDEYVTTFG